MLLRAVFIDKGCAETRLRILQVSARDIDSITLLLVKCTAVHISAKTRAVSTDEEKKTIKFQTELFEHDK